MRIKKCEIRISIVCLLFGVNWILAQQTRGEFDLRGSVKEIRSTTYPSVNLNSTEVSGFLDSELYNSIYLKFDPVGKILLRENYLDYRGKLGLYDRSEFFYNSIGKLEKLETQLIQNGEEPKKISQRKIYYYIANQMVRWDEFNFGKTNSQQWVVNSEYNRHLLSKRIYWMEDEIFSYTQYQYDSQENLQLETTFHNDGRKGLVVEYSYKNNLIRKKMKLLGNEKEIQTFIYDKDQLIRTELSNQSGIISEIKFYDQQGFLYKLHKFNHTTQQEDIFQFQYEIDPYNNWIACKILKNNHHEFTIQRTITYF